MSHVRRQRNIVGCIVAVFLLSGGGVQADEGKTYGKHHSMDTASYGEYVDSDYHGMKRHHGEMYGHGKGHGKKHGHGKKGYAHRSMAEDAHHHAFSLYTLKKKLHLSPSQVDALRPVEADYKKAVIRKRADVRIAEIDLGLLIDSPDPDRNRLQTTVDMIGRLKAELMMARIDAFLNVRKELTAEQQETFSKMVHGHMMGHGYAGSGHKGKRPHGHKD